MTGDGESQLGIVEPLELAASSEIDQLRAAHSKDFFCFTEPSAPFVFRIGIRSTEPAALFVETGVESASFITAWNPLPRGRSDGSRGDFVSAKVARVRNLSK